jgi:hypothetical protein
MLMPEAPVDFDDAFVAWENNIRFAGKISHMEPVAETHCMNELSDKHFRLSVFRPNP